MKGPYLDGRVYGLTPQITIAYVIAAFVYFEEGHACGLTTGPEGVHSWGSLHYAGNAIDLRTRDLPDWQTKQRIALELKKRLGGDYDVVLEDTHIHVEYQPKEPI